MNDQTKQASSGMVKALYLVIGLAIGCALTGGFIMWKMDPILIGAARQLAEYRSEAAESTIIFGRAPEFRGTATIGGPVVGLRATFGLVTPLASPKGTELRMIIQGRVTPTFYAESSGIVFYHFDPATGQLFGPFHPGENIEEKKDQ